MAFEHNDIATKSGLRAGLGETSMGFEHNDSVTVDVMNAAIAAGGGGGGDFNVANVTVRTGEDQFFSVEVTKEWGNDYMSIWETENGFNVSAMLIEGGENIFKLWYHGDSVNVSPYNVVESVTGDAVYDSGTGLITITGDCTITGYTDD